TSDSVFVDSGIEIELSYPADAAKAGDYFEISPPVSGRFTNYSSTLVFAPNEELAKKTTYTVTLKKGLPSADGAVLAEDYTFSFRTREGDLDSFCYAVNGFSETYLPEDPVVIDVYHSPLFLDREFDFKLYQFTNGDDYGNAIRDYYQNTSWTGDYVIPTDGLPVVMDEKLPLYHSEKKQTYYYRGEISSFVLPDDLEEGYYLAELSTELDGEEFLIQRLIQISPISVYAGVLSGQAMFFVNDTDSGNAAGNAEITFSVGGSDYSAKTDRDGVALLDYAAKDAETFHEGMTTEAYRGDSYLMETADRAGLLKIQYGGRVFYDRMNCVPDRELTPEEKYFMYLFTDRSAYLTSDTIEVWGVIRPRKSGDSVPKNLTLKLGSDLSDGIVTDVTLSPDGTFTGKFTYERLGETWWTPISLCDGDTELCEINVQIYDYEKPVYTLDPILPEYVWMPQVNGITAGVNISYYDGTPAEGRRVKIDESNPLVTDKNGYAERIVYMEDYDEQFSKPWRWFTVQYELAGIENEYLSDYRSMVAFTRDVGLDIEKTRADDLSVSFSLNAYQVDIKNLVIENSWPVPESYHGAPADLTVTAEIIRYWDEKIESGSYYDFIQKKNFPTYTYSNHEETIGTYTAEVKNGVGSFQNLPTTDPNSGYNIILRWKDSEGRATTESFYFSKPRTDSETDILSYRLYADVNLEKPYDLTIGETRSVSLRENYSTEISPQDFQGRIFYAIYQDKVLFTNVSDRPEFTFTMKEDYIPGFFMTGAYFDGKHIFPLEYDSFFYYAPDERRIDLDLQTDRESYAPADTAEVTLTAKSKDGKPIPNARILLSVVDEAAFAAADQTANPLELLYRPVYYSRADSYVSYIQHTMYDAPGGGDKGGGDPGAVRRKFLDTAYFAEGVSDTNGLLTLSVELPDNVTSWRFTALAVGEYDGGRLYAGTTRRNLSATLPLFITPIMLSE
ncbi:MAG: Ig-like domain-containing protein, partial [Ruminiclostridium sp.]|nr:Ig-like domain-containing protein [Ruminiclostridium sp.]